MINTSLAEKLTIVRVPVEELKPSAYNPRKWDEKAIAEGEAAGLPVSVDPVKAAAVLDKVSGSCCGGKGRK